MPTEIPTLPVETLAAFMRDVSRVRSTADEAAICAEVLITSDRRGSNLRDWSVEVIF